MPLKFVPKGPINNNPALVQIMAWRRLGDKPLSEPMMVRVPTHICVTRPQWVKHPHDPGVAGNYWFWRPSNKTSKLRFTGLCERYPPVTGGFPSQRASYAENYSIWWHHHEQLARAKINWSLPFYRWWSEYCGKHSNVLASACYFWYFWYTPFWIDMYIYLKVQKCLLNVISYQVTKHYLP